MVLKILDWAATSLLSPKYYTHIVLGGVLFYAIYTYAQGRKTTRERDLHGRTILITGAFTPIGLTLLDALAQRGAHIIALSSDPVDSGAPHVLVPLLRTQHSNAEIYVEHVDLSSPASIRAFCASFVKTENQRIDAVVFAHEYAPCASLLGSSRAQADAESARRAAGCATFLLTTLLLPLLLVAPAERDIRLVTLVNPFYAAAAPRFSLGAPVKREALLAAEGRRATRAAVLVRHLQRVLDALPGGAPAPRADAQESAVRVVSGRKQRSNIVAVTVSPGISRADVVAPLLGADFVRGVSSWRGLVIYILFNPLLRLVTKSPKSSIETILHALFLPTPFKSLQALATDAPTEGGAPPDQGAARRTTVPSEVLKPGALYAECAVVPLRVPPPPPPPETDGAPAVEERKTEAGNGAEPEDDGEMGGVALGGHVWDEFERELKEWEAEEVARVKESERERETREREDPGHGSARREGSTPPTVDKELPMVDEEV